jgi:2'-5' RNA ligase
MRLFAAIMPPSQVLDHLENALDRVIPSGPGRRNPRLPRSTWHLTLAFYGAVPDGYVPQMIADLSTIARSQTPFSLELAGAGSFSGRTGWIGVGGATDRLRALMVEADGLWGPTTAGQELGQHHRPHLTISRRVSDAGLGPALTALSVYRGPAWRVADLHLVESRLCEGVGGHALYASIARCPLAAD